MRPSPFPFPVRTTRIRRCPPLGDITCSVTAILQEREGERRGTGTGAALRHAASSDALTGIEELPQDFLGLSVSPDRSQRRPADTFRAHRSSRTCGSFIYRERRGQKRNCGELCLKRMHPSLARRGFTLRVHLVSAGRSDHLFNSECTGFSIKCDPSLR